MRAGRPAVAGRAYSLGRRDKMADPDKRMLWLRTLDAASAQGGAEYLEAEFASEVLIPGLMIYREGAVISRCTTLVPDPAGLYKYALRLRLPPTAAEVLRSEGTRKGYLFPDGPIGELIALFSLSLQARLYLVSTTIPPLGDDGVRLKTEYWPLRGQTGPGVDSIVFSLSDRNFTLSLPPFLDDLSALPERYHQRVVTAANHYARGLRNIGLDAEMVFVRLVSAIETVAQDQPIPGDLFDGLTAEQLFKMEQLREDQRGELRGLLHTRKAKVRFVGFLEQYSKGFFDPEPREPAHTQVTPETLADVAAAIYDARSGYLHNGDPMYLSPGVPMFPDWHMDASVGMTWGDRSFRVRTEAAVRRVLPPTGPILPTGLRT